MGNIGDPIVSGSIPAVGTSGTTYASNLNLFLTEVKNRLEALVPKASLEDGALDMNGYSVQNSSYVGVTNGLSAPTTPSNSLQAFGGNLYWINTGGAVQITSGTTLNTSLAGGITGDYGGANPAQFRFVDADQEYYAYDDYAGGAWARVWARNFDIAGGATSAQRVRLAYGGGGSYTMTLPAAAPASASMLQMDNAGTVTAANTIANSITAQDFKHTISRSFAVHPMNYREAGGSVHTFAGNAYQLGNSTNALLVPIEHLNSGDRIVGIVAYVSKTSDATNTLTLRLEKYSATGVQTNLASATNAANAPGAITLDLGVLAETFGSNDSYVVRFFQSDATPSAVDSITNIAISYTRP